MAVVNAQTLDTVERTQYFRLAAPGVLELLPFTQTVVDHDLVFFEPQPILPSATGAGRLGRPSAQVVLLKNRALPVASRPPRDAFGVWLYAGV